MDKLPPHQKRTLVILLMIAFFSIAVRLLINYNFDKSALLYVGIPFTISLLLVRFKSNDPDITWKQRYGQQLINALIIMLGSSVLLFEGFLCVAMFLPIYLFFIVTGFTADWMSRRKKTSSHLNVHFITVLILFSALEGSTTGMSIERLSQAEATRTVNLGIGEIKANLTRPIDLQKHRPWFLEIFPMPYRIDAESLNEGDIHEIHYRYHRWFFTNTHEGRMLLEIAEVQENRVTTRFLEDNSYISSYLKLHGTEIILEPVTPQQTRVTLRIHYDRLLDPAWYFGPLQHYGVSRTADFLISEVVERHE